MVIDKEKGLIVELKQAGSKSTPPLNGFKNTGKPLRVSVSVKLSFKMGRLFLIFFSLFLVLNTELLVVSEHMHPPPNHQDENLRVKREHLDGYESTSNYWRVEAQKKLRKQLDKKLNENVAKNVIFFLGKIHLEKIMNLNSD